LSEIGGDVRADVLPTLRAELNHALKAAGYPRLGSPLWRIRWVKPQILVTGSTAMLLQGIAINPDDVDIYVKPPLFRQLELRGWTKRYPDPRDPPLLESHFAGTKVHVWQDWNDRHYIGDLVEYAFDNLVFTKDGWPCISLIALRLVKTGALELNPNSARHRKHGLHVRMIDQHLGDVPMEMA
jgi:hypothetical protein